MIDCKKVGERLPAYLEGDVSELEAEELRKHFDSCDPCRKICRDLEKSGYLLRNLTEVEPPPWYTQKIMARIEEEAEKKKSWLEKLFFPLHIKIPIEAVASLLIAFLAWQVFKATESERAAYKAPPGSMPVITERYALQETGKAPAAKPALETKQELSKVPPKKEEQKKALAGAARPAEKEQEGPWATLPGAAKPYATGEKKGIIEDRQEEKSYAAAPAGRPEPPHTASAPLPAPAAPSLEKDKRMADALEPVPKKEKYDQDRAAVKARAQLKARPIGLLLQVGDTQKTGQEVLNALRQVEAGNIQRESREEIEIISALVSSQKLPALLDALKKMGGMTEGLTFPTEPEALVPVRIEIIRNK